jgi:hypothetical protein
MRKHVAIGKISDPAHHAAHAADVQRARNWEA